MANLSVKKGPEQPLLNQRQMSREHTLDLWAVSAIWFFWVTQGARLPGPMDPADRVQSPASHLPPDLANSPAVLELRFQIAGPYNVDADNRTTGYWA